MRTFSPRGPFGPPPRLADVSHELKTPLTAMRAYIETLRMPEVALDAERRDRYFETINRETRRLEARTGSANEGGGDSEKLIA
jgi:hypothetical protein